MRRNAWEENGNRKGNEKKERHNSEGKDDGWKGEAKTLNTK
jgi:hypothetical protein